MHKHRHRYCHPKVCSCKLLRIGIIVIKTLLEELNNFQLLRYINYTRLRKKISLTLYSDCYEFKTGVSRSNFLNDVICRRIGSLLLQYNVANETIKDILHVTRA